MLYLYGTEKTKELATIGLLEIFQNNFGNNNLRKENKIIENKYLCKN
jgi:hypothetical protein